MSRPPSGSRDRCPDGPRTSHQRPRNDEIKIMRTVFLATVAALALGLALPATTLAQTANPAAASSAQSRPSPVVDTAWLAANLQNPKVRVIEVSVNPGLFERGHIPGAVNVSWHRDLVDTVRRDIASRDQIQELLRRAGVAAGQHRRPLRRQQQLVRRLGRLGTRHLRGEATSACSTAGGASGRRRAGRFQHARRDPQRATHARA
jgi:hypothetical protein